MWKILTAAASVVAVAINSWWPGGKHVAPQEKVKIPVPPEAYHGTMGNEQPSNGRNVDIMGADENDQVNSGIGAVSEPKPPDTGRTEHSEANESEQSKPQEPFSSPVQPEKPPSEQDKEISPQKTMTSESIKAPEAPQATEPVEEHIEKTPEKLEPSSFSATSQETQTPEKTPEPEKVRKPFELLSATPYEESLGGAKSKALSDIDWTPQIGVPEPEKVRKPFELLSATPYKESLNGKSKAPSDNIDWIPEIRIPESHKVDASKHEEELDQLNIHKGAIVHLFEWKWQDIAKECEEFLAPRGFEAIQISPPTENLVIPGRPWWERYQIVSYKFESRSGNRAQLEEMLRRCNRVGIKVFADVVFNHMTGDAKECRGVAGSTCNPQERDYPEIPYTKDDFHWPRCDIRNMQNATEVRVCEMFNLHDLDQGKENVRNKVAAMMNDLINIGVAGFRINAAKNMYAGELYLIYSKLNNLNVGHGHPKRTKPMIFQDVHDLGGEGVQYEEYVPLALITDVRYGLKMSEYFKHKKTGLKWLQHLNKDKYLTPDLLSLVFVDNHNTERNSLYINYKQSRAYKMAIAFMLAYGYGYPFILSGYKFGDDKYDQGPPMEGGENILSPQPNQGNVCNDKWVCQHRWRQIYTMVQFNRAAYGNKVTSWWDNGNSQIAFSRGNAAFVAFNLENQPLDATIETDLPKGKYCDVISGAHVGGGKCENGRQPVSVTRDHHRARNVVRVRIEAYNENDQGSDGVFAIFDHKISRIS